MKRLFFLVIGLLCICQACAADYFYAVAPSGQTLYYTYIGNRATVSVNSNVSGDLVIPNQVVNSNGNTCSVIAIGDSAFMDCTGLTSVTIPNSVTSIGNCAFMDCTGLTSVTIPNSVTSIDYRAFYNCSGLTDTLTIHSYVTFIGKYAFGGCTGLTTVNFNATNCQTDGTIPTYPVFSGCTSLSTLNIGDNVQRIPQGIFYGCSSLTGSLTIPNSVAHISREAFADCSGLTSVTIPSSIATISYCAFENCTGLTAVYYTGDLVDWCSIQFASYTSNPLYYGHNLYINNSLVTDFNLEIPDTFTTIGNYILAGCTGISSVTIPTSVTSIGDGAFQSCSGMTETLTIPNSVTTIGNSAFNDCTGLTSVTLGNSVSSIGSCAFYRCSGLTEIHSLNTVAPTLGVSSFRYAGPGGSYGFALYIPCGTMESYNSYINNFAAYIICHLIEEFAISFTAVPYDNQMGTVQILSTPSCTSQQAVVFASPNNGYSFNHWSDNSTANPYTVAVNEDMTIIAYFEPLPQYTVTATANNTSMGSVSGGGSYIEGSTATLTATANSGYRFDHWSDNSTANPYTLTVNEDLTLVAYFEPLPQYTVTVTANNSSMGSVSGGGTYFEGSTATLTATANNGYSFSHWQDNNTSNPRTITVTGNATYTAYFEANAPTQYTITVYSANQSMGSVSGDGTYYQGTSVTISAIPKNGYRFVRWQDNDISNPRTIIVTGNATYTAYFELDAPMLYTITVNSADPSMGSVSGGGMYCQGDIINISATPNNGYHFVRWQDNDISNPRSITVNSDATYTAYFDYGTVGIDDITSADGMKVYTRGNSIVIETETEAIKHSGNQTIVVYDVMGRVIRTEAIKHSDNQTIIPVTSAGVYMVKIGDGKPHKVLVRP